MENNTITFDVAPDFRVSMKTAPLNELFQAADIETFCDAIDELIYQNARLMTRVIELTQEEDSILAYSTDDSSLYHSRMLVRVLRKIGLKAEWINKADSPPAKSSFSTN